MQISTGVVPRAKKVVIYGPEGIGKSTLASMFPNVLFSDTEDSTLDMDVARMPKPTSWTMMLQQVDYVKLNRPCQTYAVDTADWAEELCKTYLMAKNSWDAIDASGYGVRYVALATEWGKLLNKLSEVKDAGINVVMTAHAKINKFEQPDELGAYDRWELKLEKKTAPLTKEWADMVLFVNYKTMVVNVDNQGAAKGKNKAQGGQRTMYTTHRPSWDAKNRYGLPDEVPMDYAQIAHIIEPNGRVENVAAQSSVVNTAPPVTDQQPLPPEPEVKQESLDIDMASGYKQQPNDAQTQDFSRTDQVATDSNIPKALLDLMVPANVTEFEIQQVVGQKGYYTVDTPIANYDPGFIDGVLVGAWAQVFPQIEAMRSKQPF